MAAVMLILFIFAAFGHASAREYRSINGSNNSLQNPLLGISHSDLGRLSGIARYVDGCSVMIGEPQYPSPRLVSNLVHSVPPTEPYSNVRANEIFTYFAQFLAHDFGWTPATFKPGVVTVSGNNSVICNESIYIPVPVCDPTFDANCTGNCSIPCMRAACDLSAPTNQSRRFINEISQWLDANTVYGSDDDRLVGLRAFQGGLLLTSPGPDGDLPPFNTAGLPNQNDAKRFPDATLFLCGDQRANENPALTVMHVLWLREHNRVARTLSAVHPNWSDEELFQEARRWVIAELQSIVVNEFIPLLLGRKLDPYQGYNQSAAEAANFVVGLEFETVANRLGHSQLNTIIPLILNTRNLTFNGSLEVRNLFSYPGAISGGINEMLRGMAYQLAQNVDNFVIPDVRNFLFGPSPANIIGLDLAAVNLQRGRDTGMPSYNQLRVAFGLEPVTNFSQITSNVAVQAGLAAAYGGDVNKIDPWTGALTEDHASPNSAVGPLITQMSLVHFSRVRDWDRFWYENGQFDDLELCILNSVRYSDIIRLNTNLDYIQRDAFVATEILPS